MGTFLGKIQNAQQEPHPSDLRTNAYGTHLQQGWNGLPGYSQLQKPTKEGGLRITLKIKEQTAVNAIKTC